MKKSTTIVLVILGIIILISAVSYFYFQKSPTVAAPVTPAQTTTTTTETTTPQTPPSEPVVAIPKPQVEAPIDTTKTVLGTSIENRNITAYHYGTGDKEILFVGGIHGGYEWNTVLLAYQLMDYLAANPTAIPANEKVTVIPVLNPDGLNKVVGTDGRFTSADVSTSDSVVISGRFNANKVDLSRNFDCDWQSTGTWMSTPVSGGSAAFSEPESIAFKKYTDAHTPTAVVAWYSAAGGVYSSSCSKSIMPETSTLTKTYATASGYKAYTSYDYYKTTGDLVNWLAKEKIPAISVLLTTHQDTEWTKNLAGIKAVLTSYAK